MYQINLRRPFKKLGCLLVQTIILNWSSFIGIFLSKNFRLVLSPECSQNSQTNADEGPEDLANGSLGRSKNVVDTLK